MINMEWPENYEYQSTLKLRAGTRKLGHTVTPQYAPYTIRSSDVLSSDHLYGMQTTANTKAKKGVKSGSAIERSTIMHKNCRATVPLRGKIPAVRLRPILGQKSTALFAAVRRSSSNDGSGCSVRWQNWACSASSDATGVCGDAIGVLGPRTECDRYFT